MCAKLSLFPRKTMQPTFFPAMHYANLTCKLSFGQSLSYSNYLHMTDVIF